MSLNAERIRRQLETRWVGRNLHCFDEVDSTNTRAAELARAGAPGGTVVIADAQFRGRGRMGRSWVSPPGRNLYLSIVLRPPAPVVHLSQLSLLSGVATCDAVREWCEAWIKWPNDIVIDGRKVAGILTEMEGEGGQRFLVAGIGVNLNISLEEFPEDLHDKAGSLVVAVAAHAGRAEGQQPTLLTRQFTIDREHFAARLLAHMEQRYDQWISAGFAPISTAWHERSCLIGKHIEVQAPEGTIAGEVLGLDQVGALRLRLANGEEQRVLAGDVTVLDGYQVARK